MKKKEHFPIESLYMEIGFRYYLSIFKLFISNYFLFQFFDFIINFYLLYKSFKFFLEIENSALFLIFLTAIDGIDLFFNIMRNCRAEFLFLFSLTKLYDKKYLKYLLLNIIGCLFHSSAILYLFVTPFFIKKINRIFIFFVYIFGLFIFVINIELSNLILEILVNLIGKDNSIGKLIYRYMIDFNDSMRGINMGFIEKNIFFFIVFLNESKLRKLKSFNSYLINIFYLYIFTYLYFSDSRAFIDRVILLFSFSIWFLLPQVLYTIKNKDFRFLLRCYFYLYSLLKVYVSRQIITGKYNTVFDTSEAELKKYKEIDLYCTRKLMKGRSK